MAEAINVDWAPKAIDTAGARLEAMAAAPLRISPFSEERFNHWRWFWNFGGGAMTDLFSALDRCGALGHEIRPAARGADAGGQICFRSVGLS